MIRTSSSLSSTSKMTRLLVMVSTAQSEPEATPFSKLGVKTSSPAHRSDSLFDNRQTNARARIPFLGIDASEKLEDAFAMFGGDANSIIGDTHAKHLPGT